VYPWGQSWDPARANHDVDGRGQGRTSAVSKYAQKGASPFGVADLAGNVWEWCRDDFETGSLDVESAATYRTVRGGSYMSKDRDQLRCDARKSLRPLVWDTTCGFRIVATEGR
jgi:formylglycine-generating enzyme required for sulfatase activity